MPEWGEIKLMSDFINKYCSSIQFTHYELPENSKVKCDLENKFPSLFTIQSDTRGKELMLSFSNTENKLLFSMGMSGTWAYLNRRTFLFSEDKLLNYIRLSFVTPTGGKLVLIDHRRFAKWKWGKDFSKNRGPDVVNDYTKFSDNIINNYGHKDFDKPVCELMMSQKWFSGIGNYLRSTILYYLDDNPFQSLNELLEKPEIFKFLELCKSIPFLMYKKGGGELKTWKNPFNEEVNIKDIIFYGRGNSCKDKTGRTFWYNPKWENNCPYK